MGRIGTWLLAVLVCSLVAASAALAGEQQSGTALSSAATGTVLQEQPAATEKPAGEPRPETAGEIKPALQSAPSATAQIVTPEAEKAPAVEESKPQAETKPAAAELTIAPSQSVAAALSTKGKFNVELGLIGGVGFKQVDVGKITGGDHLWFSAGGGYGAEVTIGYGATDRTEVDLTLGGQESVEMPDNPDADVTFQRGFVLATGKYVVPVNDRMRFKIGGGIGRYSAGRLEVHTFGVGGGVLGVVDYNPAYGLHLSGDFEGFFATNTAFVAGVRLSTVRYKAMQYVKDGTLQPLEDLSGDFRNLYGGGADFTIRIARYF
ncbi:MAG: hypothetical protein M0042_02925 [Nitrospiraceae bacterium]|nr:hypothetical protein [Nitrospiraceae bacterium]